MKPQFFGRPERRLYGVHHPPRGGAEREEAILICHPLGAEYFRLHGPLRDLAQQLAALGFHVLRFDYFATGDSAGASDEGRPLQWLADVATAIATLESLSDRKRVSLIGFRFGATLAALAAAGRCDVARLVLWDPIVRGDAYARELFAGSDPAFGPERTRAADGFPLAPELRDALARIRLTADGLEAVEEVTIAAPALCESVVRLADSLEARGVPCDCWQIGTTPAASADPAGGEWRATAHLLVRSVVSPPARRAR